MQDDKTRVPSFTTQVRLAFPRVDALLQPFAADLGEDLPANRNHVFRVLNYYLALIAPQEWLPEPVLIAAALHDIGIWSDHTFDYLDPTVRRVRAYLDAHGLGAIEPEVEAIVRQHHKVMQYGAAHAGTIEPFRQADWIDVSLGLIRFGLPASFVRAVQAAFPDEGFHWCLVTLTAREFCRKPWRPLPMLCW